MYCSGEIKLLLILWIYDLSTACIGDGRLGYMVACSAFGNVCDYIVRGETIEELMANGARHVIEVHGHTDEQIKSWSTPENQARLMKLVKQE